MTEDRARLLRFGFWLEYATLGWNVLGVVVVGMAAWESGSSALAGFGLDSMIEIGASVVVIWQLRNTNNDRRRAALRLISVSFFVLAGYIAIQSGWAIWNQRHPLNSHLALTWLLLTVIAMLSLAFGKLRVGQSLGNPVLSAEARVTLVDGLLALSVLTGLVLNWAFAWWWADSVASLVIVVYGIAEGLHAWHESRSVGSCQPLSSDRTGLYFLRKPLI